MRFEDAQSLLHFSRYSKGNLCNSKKVNIEKIESEIKIKIYSYGLNNQKKKVSK